MKTKKITVMILAAVMTLTAAAFALTACGGGGAYTVLTPDGAPYAALVQMRRETAEIDGGKLDYQIELEPNLRTAMLEGSADFIVAPTNVGAFVHKAYIDGGGITQYKLAAGISWGVLYIITNRTDLKPYGECDGYADFLGQFEDQTIDTIGRAAIPGLSLEYILNRAEVSAEVAGATDAASIVANISKGIQFIGVLGEPVISGFRSNAAVTVLGSISEIYTDMTGADFPMASMFVKASLAEEKPEFVAAFLEKLSASITYFNENPAKVAEWAAEFGDSAALKSATLPTAKQYMNVAYKNSADSKADVKTLLTNLGSAALAPDSLFL